jgi:hypothetical protein
MSDHTALWLLFALLWIALVLVIVTARRGPWQRPTHRNKGAGIFWIPRELAFSHEGDDQFVRDVEAALRGPFPAGTMVPEVRIIRPGVDPLWGKNPPPWS